MNEINPITTTALVPVRTTNSSKPNFKAAALTPATSNDIDSFIKEQEKAKKNAKRKEYIYYGFLGTMALAAVASVYLYARSNRSVEKPVSELKEIWSDLGKSAKIDDLALPESLTNFTKKFKNSVSNPDILKRRGGRPIRSVLLYGPPGTGKTTFAKALAKEFPDSKFASLDVTSLGSEYQSVSERNLNKAVDMICKEADANPSKRFFVFIDEIDSVMMVDNSLNAKHSNDMLNEFKKCFTEKLGKRDNIITIGATNLPIDIEKGIVAGGKQLDKPMLDRFSQKVLVDLPTDSQISNAAKYHYKDCDMVTDKLRQNSAELNKISEFLARPENQTSFRTLEAIYDDAASSIEDTVSNVEIKDILKTIKSKQHEMNFTDAEFAKLLADLKITV